MQRVSLGEHHKRFYKPPTDTDATNSKLDPERVEKSKRVRAAKERLSQSKHWDALEEA